jgi:hypothetical protein
VVVSSLTWYGKKYHWQRLVAGREVALDQIFTQNIFDFKTDLTLKHDLTWATRPSEITSKHKFEIRSRFHDSLPVPYWRAVWQTLQNPDTPGMPRRVASEIRRFQQASSSLTLREYLKARAHALRWLEEKVRYKNAEIQKPPITISSLPSFTLGVQNVAQASIDFLRLDQHVKATDWIASHLAPPIQRVPLGRTIPVVDIRSNANGNISARMDLSGCDINLAEFSNRCSLAEGSFIRLSPSSENVHNGQTIGQLLRGGITCTIDSIDWVSGRIFLSPLRQNVSRYALRSWVPPAGTTVFEHGTIDDSISDFVAGKVDERLQGSSGSYVFNWFDPQNPVVPEKAILPEETRERCQEFLRSMSLPTVRLAPDQIKAAIEGLETRIQLLQGPPGTGKTTTTAISLLLKILSQRTSGDIILISAHTHTAVNTLLTRISELHNGFVSHAARTGFTVPNMILKKVFTSQLDPDLPAHIEQFAASSCALRIRRWRREGVLIIGGTTSALLKMARSLSATSQYSSLPNQFQADSLIVDESSMMVFPHFLALATLVKESGDILATGDHRQLAPIIAHDWEREDRPPAVIFQPYVSAYAAIQRIEEGKGLSPRAVRRSVLTQSFRLPPLIRDLIARIYRQDDIELTGTPREALPAQETTTVDWGAVWGGHTGLFLVVHNEYTSRQSNPTEADILESILSAAPVQASSSIAVITPHRAQRSLLRSRLTRFHEGDGPVGTIDTVERLQGGEKPTIIVSATASDLSAISSSAEFILDLNRSNVAFSRAKDRLIVVCSESLLDYIPAETDQYDSAFLWKSLRSLCSQTVVELTSGPFRIRVLTPPPDALAEH